MKRKAFTLTELLTVMAIIIIMLGITVKPIKNTLDSIKQSGSERIIKAMLAKSRSVAIGKQTLAGVRLQKTKEQQYAIFIIQNKTIPYPDDDKSIPFTAIKGRRPVKLHIEFKETQSIVFSKTGQLVIKSVMMRRDPLLANDEIYNSNGESLFQEEAAGTMSDNKLGDRYINRYTGEIIK